MSLKASRSWDLLDKPKVHHTAFVDQGTSITPYKEMPAPESSAHPAQMYSLLFASLLLLWPLQPWYYKATVYYKIFGEPVMFSTLPSSLKIIKKK